MKSMSAAIASIVILTAPLSAQWLRHTDPSLPRTQEGKANLSAPAPTAPDGRPDLSGIWLPFPDPNGKPEGVENDINARYFIDITEDIKPEDVPFQPWAKALFNERLQTEGKDDPVAHCQPTGVPALGSIPLPFKIIQMPRLNIISYEENTVFRQIFLDGRKLVTGCRTEIYGLFGWRVVRRHAGRRHRRLQRSDLARSHGPSAQRFAARD